MNIYVKMAIVVGLMTTVGAVVVLKHGGARSCCPTAMPHEAPAAVGEVPAADGEKESVTTGLPRLVELGSTTCVPCKMMKPIIEELTAEYAGKLEVVFVDVHRQSALADTFGIRVIPTQVFLDASGKELFRHEGFFPKEEILTKWKELGFDFAAVEAADGK